mmetsp:Transcript_6293/g.14204  ORF Transcript_6293/g.14204 Transcript_6293/m.14204 type:complete len:102 (-) Transcript_6293:164-469(-)
MTPLAVERKPKTFKTKPKHSMQQDNRITQDIKSMRGEPYHEKHPQQQQQTTSVRTSQDFKALIFKKYTVDGKRFSIVDCARSQHQTRQESREIPGIFFKEA